MVNVCAERAKHEHVVQRSFNWKLFGVHKDMKEASEGIPRIKCTVHGKKCPTCGD